MCVVGCQPKTDQIKGITPEEMATQKAEIAAMLDSFNVAAGRSDFRGYFSFYTDDATFFGTDATENWDKQAFMAWAKPFFDAHKTWNFSSVRRSVYMGQHPDIAWFDELLHTEMKICRGSGVVVKVNNQWKVQQYVLSMTIPNEHMKPVLKIKGPVEDSLLGTLEHKPF